ncbi:MAG: type II secretion system F family protein [Planctomycetota bacterium]
MAIASTLLIAIAVLLLTSSLLEGAQSAFTVLVPSKMLREARSELSESSVQKSQWMWSMTMLAILLIGTLLGILPIAIALAVVWLLAPRWILSYRLHRRRMLIRDQMVSCTQALANSARAGQSLAQGLESVTGEMPEPLRGELQRMMAEYQLGRPLPEALLEAKDRLKLDSFSMFASTIVVSLQRGGRVTDALERISRSLRENQRIERKLDAETAGGWRVVLILTAFPFLFLAGFYVIHPEGTLLMFQSWLGQFLVILILMLVVASVWWSRKILSIEL